MDDFQANDLLNSHQAADFLTLTGATLANWRSRGFGPCYVKIGRSVRYRVVDLRNWIEDRRVGSRERKPGQPDVEK